MRTPGVSRTDTCIIDVPETAESKSVFLNPQTFDTVPRSIICHLDLYTVNVLVEVLEKFSRHHYYCG